MTLLKGVPCRCRCNPGGAGSATWPRSSGTPHRSYLYAARLSPTASPAVEFPLPRPRPAAHQRVCPRNKARPPPPRPRRRGSGDKAGRRRVGGRRCPSPAPPGGDLSPRVPLDAGKFRSGSARKARAASGAPLAGLAAANHALCLSLSARRRRPGRGPGPCTRRGAEHRGGGEAEPSSRGQPPTCVRAGPGPRPPPPPPPLP